MRIGCNQTKVAQWAERDKPHSFRPNTARQEQLREGGIWCLDASPRMGGCTLHAVARNTGGVLIGPLGYLDLPLTLPFGPDCLGSGCALPVDPRLLPAQVDRAGLKSKSGELVRDLPPIPCMGIADFLCAIPSSAQSDMTAPDRPAGCYRGPHRLESMSRLEAPHRRHKAMGHKDRHSHYPACRQKRELHASSDGQTRCMDEVGSSGTEGEEGAHCGWSGDQADVPRQV